jgi:hypothetical protein
MSSNKKLSLLFTDYTFTVVDVAIIIENGLAGLRLIDGFP